MGNTQRLILIAISQLMVNGFIFWAGMKYQANQPQEDLTLQEYARDIECSYIEHQGWADPAQCYRAADVLIQMKTEYLKCKRENHKQL